MPRVHQLHLLSGSDGHLRCPPEHGDNIDRKKAAQPFDKYSKGWKGPEEQGRPIQCRSKCVEYVYVSVCMWTDYQYVHVRHACICLC